MADESEPTGGRCLAKVAMLAERSRIAELKCVGLSGNAQLMGNFLKYCSSAGEERVRSAPRSG